VLDHCLRQRSQRWVFCRNAPGKMLISDHDPLLFLPQRRARSAPMKSSGIRKIPKTVAAIIRPNTGGAHRMKSRGKSRGAGTLRDNEREQSKDECETCHHHRTKPKARRLNRGRVDILAKLPLLYRKGDNQNAVLGGERDQGNQADLCVDVKAQSSPTPAALVANRTDHCAGWLRFGERVRGRTYLGGADSLCSAADVDDGDRGSTHQRWD
jgi:hypothetical protein